MTYQGHLHDGVDASNMSGARCWVQAVDGSLACGQGHAVGLATNRTCLKKGMKPSRKFS